MRNINLLPWREERRQEKERQFLSVSMGIWLLSAVMVFGGYSLMVDRIDNQNNRNQFLRTEINKLEQQIKEVNQLKKRKEAMLARMEIIQQLQRNRTQIVHVFDDMVRKLPKGVSFTKLNKKANTITLTGLAQSNARISALMNNLDSSDWFTNPSLEVINVKPKDGNRISKFILKVKEQKEVGTDKTLAVNTSDKRRR